MDFHTETIDYIPDFEDSPEQPQQFTTQQIDYVPEFEDEGDFIPGVKRGVNLLQAMGYGSAALAGSGLERIGVETAGGWLKEKGMEGYQRNIEEAGQYPKSQSFKDVYTGEAGLGGTVDWVQGTLGELIPSMVEAATGAVIGTYVAPGPGTAAGAFAGRTILKNAINKLIKKMIEARVKKGLIKEGAEAVVEQQIKKEVTKQALKKLGGKVGMGAAVLPMEAGASYAGLLEEHGIDAPGSALFFGALATALEYVGGNSKLIDTMVDGIVKGDGDLIKWAAKEILTNSPLEALQELGQEALQILNTVVNTAEKFLTPQHIEEMFEGAGAGFVGGLGGGVAQVAMSKDSKQNLLDKKKEFDTGIPDDPDQSPQDFQQALKTNPDQYNEDLIFPEAMTEEELSWQEEINRQRTQPRQEPTAPVAPPIDRVQQRYAENQQQMENMAAPPDYDIKGSQNLLESNVEKFRRYKSRERSEQALQRRQQAMMQPDQPVFNRALESRPDESVMPIPGEMPGFQRGMEEPTGYHPFAALGNIMTGAGVPPASLPEQTPETVDDGIDVAPDAELLVPSDTYDQQGFQTAMGESFGMQDLPAEAISTMRPVFEHEVDPDAVNTDPTDAQKAAGNYKKEHIKIDGLDISIENPAGSTRKGKDRSGKEWATEMQSHYGYFRRSEGKDGDQVDVFVKPDTETSPKVFVVDQIDPDTGKFDEHKAILGAETEQEARDIYLSNYAKGWKGLGAVTEMDQAGFKGWLKDGTRTNRPAASVPGVEPVAEPKEFQGIERSQKDFISGKVQELGSIDAVDKTYPADTPVGKYARFKAQEMFGETTPGKSPQLEPGQAVTWQTKKGETLSGILSRKVKTNWFVEKPDGKQTLVPERQLATADKKTRKYSVTYAATPEDVGSERAQKVNSVGKTGTAYLNDNTPVKFTYEISEVADLITSHNDEMKANPAFPKELQPRVRERVASLLQVEDIAKKLNPERLGDSQGVTNGAPIISKDGMIVESGNGRVMAIRQAYSMGTGLRYKKWLIENADRFGFDPEVLKKMKRPVLVRRRQTDFYSLTDFVQKANKSEIAGLSSTEQAIIDADNLTKEDLALFHPSEDGDLTAFTNKGFIDRFIGKMSPEEQSQYLTKDGRANKQVIDRIQAAIFQKAYGSEELLAMTAEETNPDMKNILNGLNAAAAEFARAKGVDDKLAKETIDILIDGILFIRKSQREYPDLKAGQNGSKVFTQVNQALAQQDMFSGKVAEGVEKVARTISANIRSGKRIGEFLKYIGQDLRESIIDLNQMDIFGKIKDTSPIAFINKALSQVEEKYNDRQQNIFSGRNESETEKHIVQHDIRRGREESRSGDSGREKTEYGQPREKPGEVSDFVQGDLFNAKASTEKQLDLFPIMGGNKGSAKRGGLKKNRQSDSGGKGEVTPGDVRFEQTQRVDVRTTGYIQHRGLVVENPADIASIFRHLVDDPQESLYTVALDKDGQIIEIHRYTKGLKGSSQGAPGEMAGRIFAHKNAKKAYFVHNHPSGDPLYSAPDMQFSKSLIDTMKLRGISTEGVIVALDSNGDVAYSAFDANGITSQGLAPKTIKKTSIPVKERVFIEQKHKPGFVSPDTIKKVMEGRPSGFLLLTSKNQEVGFMPFPVGMPQKEITALLLEAADKTNASAYIAYTKEPENTDRTKFLEDLQLAIKTTGGAINPHVVAIEHPNGHIENIQLPKEVFFDKGYQKVSGNKPVFSTSSDIWHSALEKGISGIKQEKAPAQQWLGMINKLPGVKAEEIEWTGINDWLESQKGKVSKQDILDFVRENNIELQEVEEGDTDPRQYLLDNMFISKREASEMTNADIEALAEGMPMFQSDYTPGQGLSLKDIQKRFPGQSVFLSSDGSIAIRMKNGMGLKITQVSEFSGQDITLAMNVGRMTKGGVILGKYENKEITFNKDLVSTITRDHELYHFLADNLLNPLDRKVIQNKAEAYHKAGEFGFQWSDSMEENEANAFAQLLDEREKYRSKG